nr:MAG TPA: hypothetical protein [Caudoviricetes sp.]DAX06845.1 MAG TPA: hypothetical protein [Bacteriophage sp.]DAX23184.1 MAG TPA: hypothetical protein [Caudoviricetes sp.]DAX63630.1 MAG TPA: hypothetical protein [Bacteriophage sp.]
MKSKTEGPVISMASPSLYKYRNGKPITRSSGRRSNHAFWPSTSPRYSRLPPYCSIMLPASLITCSGMFIKR